MLFVDLLRSFILGVFCAIVKIAIRILLLLGLDHALDAGAGPGVDDVVPVPGGARGQFDVAFDQKDTGIANFSGSMLV